MRALHTQLSKIPLAVRAVSLYVALGVSAWGIGELTRPAVTQITTIQNTMATTPTSLNQSIVNGRQVISGQPVRFSIERLGIDLPVNNGVYDTASESWTLSTDAVYFATITDAPNDNRGNTFIYGHNQPQVIGNMKDIQPGDVVAVTTSNDRTFRYAYTKDAVVTPEFTSVLYEDSDTPQLTVMTCEGVWSETRRLMYFELVEVL